MARGIISHSTRMSSKEAIAKWIQHIEHRLAPETIKQYKSTIYRFRQYCPQKITEICAENVEIFINSLPVSNNTRNKYLDIIKGFAHFLSDYYNINNFCDKIRKFPKTPVKRRIITEQEYNQLLAACENQRELYILKFLAHTGLRASEFAALDWLNINHDRTMLNIIGKGGKPRAIPLSQTCRTILARQGSILFPNIKDRIGLKNLCDRISKRAGIPVVRPHAFRRYFATSLLRRGVDIYKVSKLLGHSSVKITEMYIGFNHSDFVGVTDVLD